MIYICTCNDVVTTKTGGNLNRLNKMKTLKNLVKQITETNTVTRSFGESDRHENGYVIFSDGKSFPIRQCTLNMKKTDTGFEYIDSVTINLNK